MCHAHSVSLLPQFSLSLSKSTRPVFIYYSLRANLLLIKRTVISLIPRAATPRPNLPTNPPSLFANMCIKVIERYAVCRCIYYSHAVDACPAYGRHDVKLREVLVGYTCSRHSVTSSQPAMDQPAFPDSGYSSGGKSQYYQRSSRR